MSAEAIAKRIKYENTNKPMKIKVTLPNAGGETEEFIISVR